MVKLNEHEYKEGLHIAARGYHFYPLLMALMDKADNQNLAKLRAAFPGVWESRLQWRNAPVWEVDK